MKYLSNRGVGEHGGAEMIALPSGVPGVFETVLIRDRQPVFWSDHSQRFDEGARAFGIAAPVEAEALQRHVDGVIRTNGIRDGVLRYAAWRQSGGVLWRLEVSGPRPAMRKRDFRVTWGPAVEPGADYAFKHLNRTAWTAAAHEAQANGFDQPLLTNRAGAVIEGATANVFVVRKGELLTPALGSGPLPGILRAHVIAIAREAGVPVSECAVSRGDVESADELWLTNSLIGIRPVGTLDGRTYGRARPLLDRIRTAWNARHGWDPAAPVEG